MTDRITAADFNALSKQKRRDIEGPIHKAILEFLIYELPGAAIHHSANELDLGGDPTAKAIAQAKAKSKGMRPGWPDLEILWHGMFWTLEVKAPNKKPTDEQILCGKDIIANGGRWAVVDSLDGAREMIRRWKEQGVVRLDVTGKIR